MERAVQGRDRAAELYLLGGYSRPEGERAVRGTRIRAWPALLMANGVGLSLLWLVLLLVQHHETPRSLGLEPSPWEYLAWMHVSPKEFFFEGFQTCERWEVAILSGTIAILSPLLIRDLWRHRPGRIRTSFRLRSAMLVVAFLAIEYAGAIAAWDSKAKWNECVFMERYYFEADDDELRAYSRGAETECRQWAEACLRRKRFCRRMIRRPWALLGTSWDEIRWDCERNGDHFPRPPLLVPISGTNGP